MANLEPMPISSLPEGDIQDGDKMVIYRETTGKAYQTDAGIIEELNADLTDLPFITGIVLSVGSDAELNDLIDTGEYYIGSGNKSENKPNSAGFLIVHRSSGGIVRQEFLYNGNSALIYVRHRNASGTWGSWYQVGLTAVSTSSVGDPVVMGEDDNAED